MSEATKVDSTRHGSKEAWKCELGCSALCSAGGVYEAQYSATHFVLTTDFVPLLQAAFLSYTSAHAGRLPRFPAHTLQTVHRRRALGLLTASIHLATAFALPRTNQQNLAFGTGDSYFCFMYCLHLLASVGQSEYLTFSI